MMMMMMMMMMMIIIIIIIIIIIRPKSTTNYVSNILDIIPKTILFRAWFVFRRVRKNCEKLRLVSSRLSVCLSVRPREHLDS